MGISKRNFWHETTNFDVFQFKTKPIFETDFDCWRDVKFDSM